MLSPYRNDDATPAANASRELIKAARDYHQRVN